MPSQSPGTVTQILEAVARGDQTARDKLWETIHTELLTLARRKLAKEPAACKLGTTSLVHEAFIRLTPDQHVSFENRRHFFAAAAEAMRRILVEDARKRKQLKRGDGRNPVVLKYDPVDDDCDPDEILAVNDALATLASHSARAAEVVRHRYFAGLTVRETADILGIAPRTVDSDWQFARAWLHRVLAEDSSPTKPETRNEP